MASRVSMFQFNCRSTKHSKNTAQVSCKYQHFHGNKFWLKILHSSFLFVWMYSILFSRCQCTFSVSFLWNFLYVYSHIYPPPLQHKTNLQTWELLENFWQADKKGNLKSFKLDFSRYKQKLNNLHSKIRAVISIVNANIISF